jgi:hypothetical protein
MRTFKLDQINNDPFPGWPASLPLAEIPAFKNSVPIQYKLVCVSQGHSSARLEPEYRLRGLGYAGHLCCQGHHFFHPGGAA